MQILGFDLWFLTLMYVPKSVGSSGLWLSVLLLKYFMQVKNKWLLDQIMKM